MISSKTLKNLLFLSSIVFLLFLNEGGVLACDSCGGRSVGATWCEGTTKYECKSCSAVDCVPDAGCGPPRCTQRGKATCDCSCPLGASGKYTSAIGSCDGNGPSRPCGDCIPEGCGHSAFFPEKKFASLFDNNEGSYLSEMKNREKLDVKLESNEEVKTEVNLKKAEKSSTPFKIKVLSASILEKAKEIVQLIVRFLSNSPLFYWFAQR